MNTNHNVNVALEHDFLVIGIELFLAHPINCSALHAQVVSLRKKNVATWEPRKPNPILTKFLQCALGIFNQAMHLCGPAKIDTLVWHFSVIMHLGNSVCHQFSLAGQQSHSCGQAFCGARDP